MSYCKSLQMRVMELEEMQSHSRQKTSPSRVARNIEAVTPSQSPRTAVNSRHGSRLTKSVRLQSPASSANNTTTNGGAALSTDPYTMNNIMAGIDKRIVALKEIFRKGDPHEERALAAIRIQSVMRGFLTRQKMQLFQRSRRHWRWIRCRPVVLLLDTLLSLQSKVFLKMQMLRLNKNIKKLQVFFNKWSIISKQNSPIRKKVRQAAEERILLKKRAWVRQVFDALRQVLIGRFSTKQAIVDRRRMLEDIRRDLSARMMDQGLLGVVPQMEMDKELHRRIIIKFEARKRYLAMRFIFDKCLLKLTQTARKRDATARKHCFDVLAGKCFYAWSDYIYLVGLGLDRKRWPGPRKYEIRYNQKRVDNFSRNRIRRMIFRGWKAYFKIQLKVKSAVRKRCAQLAQSAFFAWRGAAKKQRVLRWNVYDSWKGYARLMLYNPFYSWANYVKGIKNSFVEQLRIATSYLRWKTRQKMLKIIKTWRHQAVFGRLDGLYTRQMLLKTLGEQKMMCNNMQKLMGDQTMELEECRITVVQEIAKRNQLELRLQQSTLDMTQLKMLNHHLEQEVLRLQDVLDSVVSINPNQVEYLLKMQPHFKFKQRNIPISSSLPADSTPPDNINTSNKTEGKADKSGVEASKFAESSVDASTANAPPSAASESLHSASEGEAALGGGLNTSSIASSVQEANQSLLEDSTASQPPLIAAAPPPTSPPRPLTPPPSLSPVHQDSSAKLTSHPTSHSHKHGDDTGREDPSPDKALTQPKPSATPASATIIHPAVSDEDQRLLLRVKWLMARFRDSGAHDLRHEHTQPSLELLIEKNKNTLDATAAALAVTELDSFDPSRKDSRRGRRKNKDKQFSDDHSVNSADSNAESVTSIQIRSRPGILPVQPTQLPMESDNNAVRTAVVSDNEKATEMLLAMLDFIDLGEIASFGSQDRQEWIQHLLQTAAEGSFAAAAEAAASPEVQAAAGAAAGAAEGAEAVETSSMGAAQLEQSLERHQVLHPHLAIDASGASTARDDSTNPVSPNRPLDLDFDGEDGRSMTSSQSTHHLHRQHTGLQLEEESWRDTLMRLRALHPNAGNSSGKAQPLDAYASDIGMINRVLQMKEHLKDVEKLHEDKFGQVLQAHLTKKSDIVGQDPLLNSEFHSLNIYASNLKTTMKKHGN